MFALLAATALTVSPVSVPDNPCDPPAVVTNCYQAQLPAETNGRQINTPNGIGVMVNGQVIVPNPTPTPTHPVPTPRRPTHPHATPAAPSVHPLPRSAVVAFEDAIRAFLGDDVYHWRVKPE